MSEEQVKELLEEIAPEDKPEYRYIDCSDSTGYTDDNQYNRIVAALKQNIELQQENSELNKKLEEVEKQGMETLIQIEKLTKNQKEVTDIVNNLIHGIVEHLSDVYAGKENEVRIGDYIFKVKKDHVDFKYEPIKKAEPIKLEVLITENSDETKLCPICNKEIGKYPAISRKDNKTEICSNCGMLEALAIFSESQKEEV